MISLGENVTLGFQLKCLIDFVSVLIGLFFNAMSLKDIHLVRKS